MDHSYSTGQSQDVSALVILTFRTYQSERKQEEADHTPKYVRKAIYSGMFECATSGLTA